MALCYIAASSNGTRDNIWGIYPTYEEAFTRLKQVWADGNPDPGVMGAKTVEELGYDAKIVEIKDGGEEIYIEIHEW